MGQRLPGETPPFAPGPFESWDNPSRTTEAVADRRARNKRPKDPPLYKQAKPKKVEQRGLWAEFAAQEEEARRK
jgi:hypothetical protein